MPKTRTNRPSSENVTRSHSKATTRHIRTGECDVVDLERAARIKELIGDDTNVSFSHACGFSEGTLRKYLKGATPGSDKMSAMAKYRRVRMEWLETGAPPKYERDLAALAQSQSQSNVGHSTTLRANQYVTSASSEHHDGFVNSALMRLCMLACNQVHGEDFSKSLLLVQLEYACDFYNQLVSMANGKGPRASLDDFCQLDVPAIADQLRFLLQMGWARPFPYQASESEVQLKAIRLK